MKITTATSGLRQIRVHRNTMGCKGAAARYQSGKWQIFTPTDGLIDDPVSLMPTRDGKMWVMGAHNGKSAICHFQPGEKNHWQRETSIFTGWQVGRSYEASDGTLWFGDILVNGNQGTGLYRYDPSAPPEQAWMIFGQTDGFVRRDRHLRESNAALSDANKKLFQANVEIQQQNERKSAFLASMSHELRTPMNAIKGFTNLVLRRARNVLPDQQKENLQKVDQASNHLLAMINDLLDLSKIEAGRMDVSPTSFRVEHLIATCVSTVSPLVKDAVSDTGKGIPADELPTIFDEYRQVKGSESSVQKGTGLGLSITKKFAELLGGTISAESEIGKGSVFMVKIPVPYDDL